MHRITFVGWGMKIAVKKTLMSLDVQTSRIHMGGLLPKTDPDTYLKYKMHHTRQSLGVRYKAVYLKKPQLFALPRHQSLGRSAAYPDLFKYTSNLPVLAAARGTYSPVFNSTKLRPPLMLRPLMYSLATQWDL